MKPLRTAIVGVGRHGSRYAKHAANDIDGIELVAVSRRNETEGGALARELGCEFTPEARSLCERDDIDAVIFVTVPAVLDELVPIAAANGKRLLVEKPVARDLASGRRILQAIDDAGVYCMAGQTLRFNAVAEAMRDRVAQLGRIDSLVFSQRYPPQLGHAWLDDPARSGGGNILHTGVHCFDLIRFITGLEPESVACSMHSVYTEHTEDNFAATIRLRAANTETAELGAQTHPALALVTCSRSSQARNGLIEISGENGQLIGDHVLNTLAEITSAGRRVIEVGRARMTVLETLGRFAADALADAPSPIAYRDALQAVAVAEACYRANRRGSFEKIERA